MSNKIVMDMVSVCIDYLPLFYIPLSEDNESWKLDELMHIETGVLSITSKILSAHRYHIDYS